MENKRRIINKREFIRLVARDSGFALHDVEDLWASVENVFFQAIINDMELRIHNFCKMYVKHIPANIGWDGIRGKRYERKPSDRIVFRVSSVFKRLLKESKNEFFDDEDLNQL